MINKFFNFLVREHNVTLGVFSFKDKKFIFICLLYLASFLLFINDGFFKDNDGLFAYSQGGITILLAWIIVASLNWELNLFGKAAGANLLLQCLQFLPITMLLARLVGKTSHLEQNNSVLVGIFEALKNTGYHFFGDISPHIPEFIKDISGNITIYLFAIVILLVLSLKNPKIKIGALVTILGACIAYSIEKRWSSNNIFPILGVLTLALGLSLQYYQYKEIIYFENIINQLNRKESVDSLLYATILKIMTRIYENNGISTDSINHLVKSEYSKHQNYSDDKLNLISRDVMQIIIKEYNLAYLTINDETSKLIANPKLFYYNNILLYVARVPRIAFISILAIIISISPIDFIPDVVPFIGTLDDVAISILSIFIIKNDCTIPQKQ